MNPILALIIANVIWGAASPIFKFALTNVPPFTLAFLRFFIAGIIFIPLVIGKWQKLEMRDWFKLILLGFFGISLNISFYFLGLRMTESINAPIIASSGPVIIYILSILFLKEKIKFKKTVGMAIGLIGVLVIIFSPFIIDGKKIAMGEINGNIFFFIATMGAVLQTVFARDIMKKVNVFQASVVTFFFGALTFTPFLFNEFRTWGFQDLNINGWTGIIFGAVFSSAIGYGLFYYGLRKIEAGDAGIFTYIDPVTAVIIAIPLLHEYPSVLYFFGSILVFGGIYLAEGRIHWHPFHLLKKIEKEATVINKKIETAVNEITEIK